LSFPWKRESREINPAAGMTALATFLRDHQLKGNIQKEVKADG